MDLNDYIGQVITGEELNVLLKGMPMLKFMNNDDIHFGMQYTTGENQDILPFNPAGESKPGGIYVITLANYYQYYLNYGKWARKVSVDPDALIYIEPNKLKCNKVILDKRMQKNRLIKKLFMEIPPEMAENIIKKNGLVLEHIPSDSKTQRLMMEAVKQNGHALKFISPCIRTNEMILEAVKNNGYALKYVDTRARTREIVDAAKKECGRVIEYIESDARH